MLVKRWKLTMNQGIRGNSATALSWSQSRSKSCVSWNTWDDDHWSSLMWQSNDANYQYNDDDHNLWLLHGGPGLSGGAWARIAYLWYLFAQSTHSVHNPHSQCTKHTLDTLFTAHVTADTVRTKNSALYDEDSDIGAKFYSRSVRVGAAEPDP